jgi:hypothetical protein
METPLLSDILHNLVEYDLDIIPFKSHDVAAFLDGDALARDGLREVVVSRGGGLLQELDPLGDQVPVVFQDQPPVFRRGDGIAQLAAPPLVFSSIIAA